MAPEHYCFCTPGLFLRIHNSVMAPNDVAFLTQYYSVLQLAVRGLVRSVHDEVDAFDDGGWWEGRVTQVGKQRCKVQPFISNTLLTVKRADVRTGVVWHGPGWSLRQAAGQLHGLCVATSPGSLTLAHSCRCPDSVLGQAWLTILLLHCSHASILTTNLLCSNLMLSRKSS